MSPEGSQGIRYRPLGSPIFSWFPDCRQGPACFFVPGPAVKRTSSLPLTCEQSYGLMGALAVWLPVSTPRVSLTPTGRRISLWPTHSTNYPIQSSGRVFHTEVCDDELGIIGRESDARSLACGRDPFTDNPPTYKGPLFPSRLLPPLELSPFRHPPSSVSVCAHQRHQSCQRNDVQAASTRAPAPIWAKRAPNRTS